MLNRDYDVDIDEDDLDDEMGQLEQEIKAEKEISKKQANNQKQQLNNIWSSNPHHSLIVYLLIIIFINIMILYSLIYKITLFTLEFGLQIDCHLPTDYLIVKGVHTWMYLFKLLVYSYSFLFYKRPRVHVLHVQNIQIQWSVQNLKLLRRFIVDGKQPKTHENHQQQNKVCVEA